MTLYSLLIFLPSLLCGGLIAHLFWRGEGAAALLLKASAGVGLGLGINSILFFASLLIAPGKFNILPITLALLAALLSALVLKERGRKWKLSILPRLTRSQWGVTAAAGLAGVLMLWTFHNLYLSLPQGWIDSWTIWNRAARAIYRDPQNWQATLSPELAWANHPDYPLLIPFNIAWGWQTLGGETTRVPMVEAMLFMLASLGMLYGALCLTRGMVQAGLGALLLASTPVFVRTASYQIADVPVMFFFLAALIFLYLALARQERGLMILAGLMAGLAGWTKNEGLLFILACVIGLALTQYTDLKRLLPFYASGLALPLAVILFFKNMAPPSDLAAAGIGSLLASLTDFSRYEQIFGALGPAIFSFGYWTITSLPLVLAVYMLIAGFAPAPGTRRNLFTVGVIIVLQLLGYCIVFLLTPYDLEWHLSTSLWRLLLQIFPAVLFVYLNVIRSPENLFQEATS